MHHALVGTQAGGRVRRTHWQGAGGVGHTGRGQGGQGTHKGAVFCRGRGDNGLCGARRGGRHIGMDEGEAWAGGEWGAHRYERMDRHTGMGCMP